MSKPTSPTQAKTGDDTHINPHASPPPLASDEEANDASTLIEAPVVKPSRAGKLKKHDFSDGGGSGGAEAFRRGKRPIPKPR